MSGGWQNCAREVLLMVRVWRSQTSTSIVCLESRRELTLRQPYIKLKVLQTTFIQIFGDPLVLLLMMVPYMLTFIDDFSRKVWVFFLKSKVEVFSYIKQQKAVIEKQTEKKIKRLRIDNGLEFYSLEFEEFCKKKGIVRHKTVRHTPQQNGIAKWMNRTLLERAWCMLSNAGLAKSFWMEAISMVSYLVN